MNYSVSTLGLAVAGALLTPAAACASTIVIADFDGAFGSFNLTESGSFSHDFVFTTATDGTLSASVTAAKVGPLGGLTFTSILLNGIALTDRTNGSQFFEITDLYALAGTHVLRIAGSGHGSFGGSVSAISAVPEAGSWALMIAGFGLIGVTVRRQSTKVAFAV
jgi:hypothetical protein